MKRFLIAILFLLCGCNGEYEHIKLATDLRQKLPFYANTAFSLSMYPKIKGGDSVYLVAKPYENLQIGDIVLFTVPNKKTLVLHGISGKEGGRFKTRGINNLTSDVGYLTRENYIGCVDHILSKNAAGKYPVTSLQAILTASDK